MKPHISIDEARVRFLAAIDEIYYTAEQLALHMCVTSSYEAAKDVLDGLVCRVDDMPMDIENIRDDACGED